MSLTPMLHILCRESISTLSASNLDLDSFDYLVGDDITGMEVDVIVEIWVGLKCVLLDEINRWERILVRWRAEMLGFE